MNISLKWLNDLIDISGISVQEYCDGMTYSGTKVEGYEVLDDEIKNVVVGKIDKIEKHPDADKLLVCMLDVGKEADIQIVTGAHNISVGDLVPVCLDGAELPGGKTIKSGKLRGVVSDGMLCSIAELGLTKHDFPNAAEDGIFILEGDQTPGTDIKKALMMDDTAVEFELTFNRPDCLGLVGIARETAATFGRKFDYKLPEVKPSASSENVSDYLSVEIKNSDLCPRYTAAVVKNVKIAPSPLWLRMRLRAIGIRPINNIVDITNYVMAEYGQPMHAFDYSFIGSHKIIVRNANEGEIITTLDSKEHKLTSDMLCIADGEKAVALAGIMGGENSEIIDSTNTVVFESASFNRFGIRKTSRALGVRTESSGKFEKGLPAYNTYPALLRALELVQLLGCGEVVNGIIDVCNIDIGSKAIPFDHNKVNRLLGTDISYEKMAEILASLDLKVEGDKLIVPPYRTDLENTADIAEEVARIYGYNNIASTLFMSGVTEGRYTDIQKFRIALKNACVSLGFNEVYTYSFFSPKCYDAILLTESSPLRNSIKIINPLGEENSIMRTTALPSVLECASYNKSRNSAELKLFELATTYFPAENGFSEEKKELVLVADGGKTFFTVKGYAEAILKSIGIVGARFERPDGNEELPLQAFHPGKSAVITYGGKVLGVLGELHPTVADGYDLPKNTNAVVLYAETLYASDKKEKHFSKIPQYPAMERDIALVMDDDVSAGTVCDMIRSYLPRNLESVTPFDVYKGKGIEEGKKSVAFRLVMRDQDKTMSDDEADAMISKVLKKLANDPDHNIVLRN